MCLSVWSHQHALILFVHFQFSTSTLTHFFVCKTNGTYLPVWCLSLPPVVLPSRCNRLPLFHKSIKNSSDTDTALTNVIHHFKLCIYFTNYFTTLLIMLLKKNNCCFYLDCALFVSITGKLNETYGWASCFETHNNPFSLISGGMTLHLTGLQLQRSWY